MKWKNKKNKVTKRSAFLMGHINLNKIDSGTETE